jgi:hypothetical protein
MGTPPAAPGEGFLPAGVRPLRFDDPAELGGHRLVGRLGSGGMSVVYLGRDPLEGFVAIKTAHGGPADVDLARRFAAEAECLRRLPEGCTARLVKDGATRTPPYLVIEYVEGKSLAHVVDTGGPLPPEQVSAVATGVLRALAAVHRAGLVHRDIKPPNIVLTVSGPRLIDFGIAQEVGASGGPTGPETVMGSAGWIPPERLNRQSATPASDVFGWGALVVYAATGRNPFGQADAEELARRIVAEPPDLDGVEAPLRDLVAESLAKDPSARPSAEELLARISGNILAAPVDVAAPAEADVAAPAEAEDAEDGDTGEATEPEDAGAAEEPVVTAADSDAEPDSEPVPDAEPELAPPIRWRRPAAAAAAVAVATALTAVLLTRGADHDMARTPPSGAPSVARPGDGTPRATHREPVVRERSGRPTTRPEEPSGRRSSHPGTPSDTPLIVPSLVDPSLPTILEDGKDKGTGHGVPTPEDTGGVGVTDIG